MTSVINIYNNISKFTIVFQHQKNNMTVLCINLHENKKTAINAVKDYAIIAMKTSAPSASDNTK